jgi:hypothetical protein
MCLLGGPRPPNMVTLGTVAIWTIRLKVSWEALDHINRQLTGSSESRSKSSSVSFSSSAHLIAHQQQVVHFVQDAAPGPRARRAGPPYTASAPSTGPAPSPRRHQTLAYRQPHETRQDRASMLVRERTDWDVSTRASLCS